MDQNTDAAQYQTILNALQNAINALNGSPMPRPPSGTGPSQ